MRGLDRDLLIDTGVGVHSLPAFLKFSGLRKEPKKPLSVILTHLHFDHSGGAHQFPLVHIHQQEEEYVSSGDSYMTASWVTSEEIVPKPKGWKARDYSVKPANVKGVEEGHIFNLGDRDFQVLHLPGHSPGSIALHDQDAGVLATGDTLYQTSHGLIDWYPGSCSLEMKKSVERLVCLAKEGRVGTVLPGHNNVIESKEMVEIGEHHMEKCDWKRQIRKRMSRLRAMMILKGNTMINMPEIMRQAISN